MATFEIRTASDGSVTHRAKVRLKGHPAEYATFKRLTDAKRWAQSTESAIREGRHFRTAEARKHDVSALVDRYLRDVVPLGPRNAANKKQHLAWWKGRLGPTLLSDVTPALLTQCRDELLGRPKASGGQRATGTVLRYLATLSHAFAIAMKDWQWVTDNPVLKISKPRQARGRERYLSDDELKRLLGACAESTSKFLLPVVVLALSTGMRRGEIMGLRWGNVDLARKQVLLTDTKNGSSRALPLASAALDHLVALAKVRRIDSDVVFYGNVAGKAVDLTKPWETALRKAKVADFRFHDLRHTAASYLAMNGATLLEIAEILGHKTLQMVKRYSHLSNSHTSAVVTAMNHKMFGGEQK